MERRKVALLLIAIGMIILCTGCWSRRELNELAVVIALGIDTVDNQYEVTVQMVDPSQMTKSRVSDRSPVTTFTERDKSIIVAFRKITSMASRKMYFAHLKLVIFDEETARKGISDPLDLLIRNHEIRPDFYLAVVRNKKAKDVMNFVSPTEVLPAMDMYKSLKVSQQFWAPTAAVNAKDILKTLSSKGIEPVLTGMKLTGDIKKGQSKANVQNPIVYGNFNYSGIGVFRDDRLLGWLNDSDSKAYTYIRNKITSTVGAAKCPQSKGEFTVQVYESKINILPKIVEGKPRIKLDVFIQSNLEEVECITDLKNDELILALEKSLNEALRKIIEDGVHEVQKKYGADIFGFGEAFHRKYPKQWHEWQSDWDKTFSKLPVEIKIDYHILGFGSIVSPFDHDSSKEK